MSFHFYQKPLLGSTKVKNSTFVGEAGRFVVGVSPFVGVGDSLVPIAITPGFIFEYAFGGDRFRGETRRGSGIFSLGRELRLPERKTVFLQ